MRSSRFVARLVSIVAIAAACSCAAGTLPPEHVTAAVAFASDGQLAIHVIANAQPTPAPSDERQAMRYELRDANGTLVDSGLVPDPRLGVAETTPGSTMSGRAGIGDTGSSVLRLSNIDGTLTLFRYDPSGWIALASAPMHHWVPGTNPSIGTTVDAIGIDPLDFPRGRVQVLRDATRGPAAVTLLFVSDGFTDAQMDTYHEVVDRYVHDLDVHPDYGPYVHSFRFLSQEVPSTHSGYALIRDYGDILRVHPNTTFGVTCNNTPTAALLALGPNTLGHLRAAALRASAHADLVIIVSNNDNRDCRYAGSTIPTEMTLLSTPMLDDPDRSEPLFPHELGHGLFMLGDEYTVSDVPDAICGLLHHVPFPNIGRSPNRSDLPAFWRDAITPGVPVPTPNTSAYDDSVVGEFEGAELCAHGLYRAQHRCLMNNGYDHPQFCAVCRHEMDHFFSSRGVRADTCGDGICGAWESADSCARDCGCGNGVCDGAETCDSCEADCGACAPPPPTCSCGTRTCGDDGCGHSCGTCPSGQGCNASGHCDPCAAHTDCTSCAGDAHNCGWCASSNRCIQTTDSTGASVCTGHWAWVPSACCVPNCAGRSCGDDGCGGSCGSCRSDQVCGTNGQCECLPGETDCGGRCAPLGSDPANCGACGNACATGAPCCNGSCCGVGDHCSAGMYCT